MECGDGHAVGAPVRLAHAATMGQIGVQSGELIMTAQGFVKKEHRECLLVADNAAVLLAMMRDFRPPVLGKWIEDMVLAER